MNPASQVRCRDDEHHARFATSPALLLVLLVGCLAGLMSASTPTASSRFLDHDASVDANKASGRAQNRKLIHSFSQPQEDAFTIGASLHNYTSPFLPDANLILTQVIATKSAPQVLIDTADGKGTLVVIFLADQADVSAAFAMTDQNERGWFVYKTLTEHAARTQLDLQSFLAAHGIMYQSFWVTNMLIATVDRSLVEQLAARPDVARVDSNRPARWIEDPVIEHSSKGPPVPKTPNAAEWGVLNVNAPAVWALGFTGQGIVVGDLDTGMRWTHSALKPSYRGWNGVTADHNFNWHDAIHTGGGICGANTVAPCDDDGHGSHTAGTMIGDDGAGNQIGVAPGAKWIGCRNMDQGNGTPATYTECFQFMIAPTDLAGNNPNPALPCGAVARALARASLRSLKARLSDHALPDGRATAPYLRNLWMTSLSVVDFPKV